MGEQPLASLCCCRRMELPTRSTSIYYFQKRKDSSPVGLQLGLEYLNFLNKDFLNSAVGVVEG